jgi:hypothetical protein
MVSPASKAMVCDTVRVKFRDFCVIEFDPSFAICSGRGSLLDVRIIVTRFCSTGVDKDTDQLEHIRHTRLLRLLEVVNVIGGHIDLIRKLKEIVYLASHARHDVKIKALQVEYEVIGNVLETSSDLR